MLKSKTGFVAVLALLLYALPPSYLLHYAYETRHIVATESNSGAINVLKYGAVGDNQTDDCQAFIEAFAAAKKYSASIFIPNRRYLVNCQLEIHSGLIIRSDGATLRQVRELPVTLSAMHVNNWVIQGPLYLMGTRTASGQPGEGVGLFIQGGSNFIVDKLTVKDFKGAGIVMDSGKGDRQMEAVYWRADRGKFAFVSLVNNGVGMKIKSSLSENPMEYNLLTLMSFMNNDVALQVGTANNIMTTSNIVNNGSGIEIEKQQTNNEGHGIFSAVNINHNQQHSIRLSDIKSGYTFDACHVYANSPTSGKIDIRQSQGVHFTGCMLDAPVEYTGGSVNAILGSYIAGHSFSVHGAESANFIRSGNFSYRGVGTDQ